jgi:Cu(I)/Ag(I) efflux system periplasmic protein CusF
MKSVPDRLLALAAAALIAAPALAQHADRQAQPPAGRSVQAGDADLAEAEVRRIDPAAGTILMKHGEIRNLGMSAMTMGFKLRDPKLAAGIKAGDKVRFAAVQDGETLVVTKIVKR